MGAWGKYGVALLALGAIAVAITIGLYRAAPERHRGNTARRVYDQAQMLSGEQTQAIERYHAALLNEHDIDYRVFIPGEAKDLDTATLARRLYASLNVGNQSASGRGLLLLIEPYQNEVRLEVSVALEGVYTDAFVSYVQHRQMIPFFKTGSVADGVLAATELIFSRAQEAQRGHAFSPPMDSGTAGGGVSNAADIGSGRDRSFARGPDVAAASSDPLATYHAYVRAMQARNGSANLAIYTQDTQAMMARHTVTPAQMDNVAQSLARCAGAETRMAERYAVVRFPVAKRQCPPYFMMHENGAWRLNLTLMRTALRFNHRNEWRLSGGFEALSAPYRFAFADWRFDQHGFPHE